MKFKPARLLLPRFLLLDNTPLCALWPPHHLGLLHLLCLSSGREMQVFQDMLERSSCIRASNIFLDTCSAKWCQQV